jgi:hypothetical protein
MIKTIGLVVAMCLALQAKPSEPTSPMVCDSANALLLAALADGDFDTRERAQADLIDGGLSTWEFLKSVRPSTEDPDVCQRCDKIIFELDLQLLSDEILMDRATAFVSQRRFSQAARCVGAVENRARHWKAALDHGSNIPWLNAFLKSAHCDAIATYASIRGTTESLSTLLYNDNSDTIYGEHGAYQGHPECKLTKVNKTWYVWLNADKVTLEFNPDSGSSAE